MSEYEFEEIYLVSDKIVSVPSEEIDALEREIGSLPLGYRKFLERCGADGSLMDDINIWPPNVVLSEVIRQRENIQFESCFRTVDDTQRLEEQDFDDVWVFGSDGIGFSYCYFPRHPGVLFQIVSGGTPICHQRAFAEVSTFWSRNVKHPFPYFTPSDRTARRSRSVQSYEFDSPVSQETLARFVANYWDERELPSICVKLPAQHEDGEANDRMLFVKGIGCAVSICRDEENYPGKIYGSFTSDPQHHNRVKKCVNSLRHELLSYER